MLTQYEKLLNGLPEIARHEQPQHPAARKRSSANADILRLLDDHEIDAVLPEPVM